jgi:hypothetical protein
MARRINLYDVQCSMKLSLFEYLLNCHWIQCHWIWGGETPPCESILLSLSLFYMYNFHLIIWLCYVKAFFSAFHFTTFTCIYIYTYIHACCINITIFSKMHILPCCSPTNSWRCWNKSSDNLTMGLISGWMGFVCPHTSSRRCCKSSQPLTYERT